MRLTLVCTILAAAIIRLLAAAGDLWLDEIWSLQAATAEAHWWGIFTSLHSDNNHHLTSLWLRTIGPLQQPLLYRSVSVLASLLTIPVLYLSPLLRTPAERAFAVVAGAASFPLILYGSEARGYALATLAAVLMLHCAASFLRGEHPDWSRRLFTASVLIGVLSHATFLFALLAVAGWVLVQRRRVPLAATLPFLRGSLLIVAVYATAILQPMQIAGGDAIPLTCIATEFVRTVFGHPALALTITVAVIADLRRRPDFLLLLGLLLIVPALAATQAGYLHLRYFVIVVPFLLLFSARALGSMANHSRAGAVLSTGIAVIWLCTQALPARDLLRYGRGQSAQLTRTLLASPFRRVASDHDNRVRTVLRHYAAPGELAFRDDGGEADWLVLQRERPDAIPGTLHTRAGQTFRFVRHFPAAPLSGLHWYLYLAIDRKENTTATSSSNKTRHSEATRN